MSEKCEKCNNHYCCKNIGVEDLGILEETKVPKILFAKVKENAIIPSKEREDAGYDIYACWDGLTSSDKIIKPHTTKLIPTGIACALPEDYYFKVEERGSTGSKGIKKSAGVIDSGYRGEIFIAISNVNDKYLVFGNKEETISEAKREFETYKNIDIDNLTEEEILTMGTFLLNNDKEYYNSLSDKEQIDFIKQTYGVLKDSKNIEKILFAIKDAIYYPENKAIAQLILHAVYKVPTKEISYEELKNIPSKRGIGKLGSSNK